MFIVGVSVALSLQAERSISLSTTNLDITVSWQDSGVLQTSSDLISWNDERSITNGQTISANDQHNF